jgi:hypothetical protein
MGSVATEVVKKDALSVILVHHDPRKAAAGED